MSGTSQKSFTFKAQCTVEKRGRENLDFFFSERVKGFISLITRFGLIFDTLTSTIGECS